MAEENTQEKWTDIIVHYYDCEVCWSSFDNRKYPRTEVAGHRKVCPNCIEKAKASPRPYGDILIELTPPANYGEEDTDYLRLQSEFDKMKREVEITMLSCKVPGWSFKVTER